MIWSTSSPNLLASSAIGADFGRGCPKFGQNGPEFIRFSAILAEFGMDLTKFGRNRPDSVRSFVPVWAARSDRHVGISFRSALGRNVRACASKDNCSGAFLTCVLLLRLTLECPPSRRVRQWLLRGRMGAPMMVPERLLSQTFRWHHLLVDPPHMRLNCTSKPAQMWP